MQMTTMIRSAAVTATVVILAGAVMPAHGQSQHSLAEGNWALQFRIGQDFTLGSFSGGVISAKHHRSADRALRYGVTLGSQHVNRDNGPNTSSTGVGLVAEFLTYPTLSRDPGGDIHLFWGAGPAVQFQRQTAESPTGDRISSQLLTVGAVGSIGAEWFVRPRIGLTAEYQSGVNVGFGDERRTVNLGQQGVRFGASVYFGS
jgi:hypothetical protein